MNLAEMAFLYLAIAASAGSLAFLVGQKASGRTPPAVAGCYEHASRLESIARDLRTVHDEAAAAHDALDAARAELDEASVTLRRGADLIV